MIDNSRNRDIAWQAIFDSYKIYEHDFEESPFVLSASQIKLATSQFTNTGQREVRILCKQDERGDRPLVFQERGLFILPVRNGQYAIVKGEGYVDIPVIGGAEEIYESQLDFNLVTPLIGDSEMQHLDYAYATSLIRSFLEDDSLVLTIRGRKYTPKFSFKIRHHTILVESVQTEVDAGYEGRSQVVLVEAKRETTNTIIRQLYYPFRQWQHHIDMSKTNKTISTLFFEKKGQRYSFWQFHFTDAYDYNSRQLVRSKKYIIANLSNSF